MDATETAILGLLHEHAVAGLTRTEIYAAEDHAASPKAVAGALAGLRKSGRAARDGAGRWRPQSRTGADDAPAAPAPRDASARRADSERDGDDAGEAHRDGANNQPERQTKIAAAIDYCRAHPRCSAAEARRATGDRLIGKRLQHAVHQFSPPLASYRDDHGVRRFYAIGEDAARQPAPDIGAPAVAPSPASDPQAPSAASDPQAPSPAVDPQAPSAASDLQAGCKHDVDKPEPDLILTGFARALAAVADVGTYGAHKYSRHGWAAVADGAYRYRNAGQRHALARAVGETYDADSGLPHLAHEAWNKLAELELALRAAAATRADNTRRTTSINRSKTT